MVAVGIDLEVVGSNRRTNEIVNSANHPILIETRHPIDTLDDRGIDFGDTLVTNRIVDVGVESCEEQVDEAPRQLRMLLQSLFGELPTVLKPDLVQIASERSQYRYLAWVHTGAEHETVETIVVDGGVPHRLKCLLDQPGENVELCLRAKMAQRKIVDPDQITVTRLHLIRALVHNGDPEIGKARHHRGERDPIAAAVHLEIELGAWLAGLAIDLETKRVFRHSLHLHDVVDRGPRVERGAVLPRETVAVVARYSNARVFTKLID